MTVVMEPVILKGLRAIAKKFNVSQDDVRRWAKTPGSPIVTLTYSKGQPRYMAEVNRLYDWLLERGRQKAA